MPRKQATGCGICPSARATICPWLSLHWARLHVGNDMLRRRCVLFPARATNEECLLFYLFLHTHLRPTAFRGSCVSISSAKTRNYCSPSDRCVQRSQHPQPCLPSTTCMHEGLREEERPQGKVKHAAMMLASVARRSPRALPVTPQLVAVKVATFRL